LDIRRRSFGLSLSILVTRLIRRNDVFGGADKLNLVAQYRPTKRKGGRGCQ
jgi:hypothetical protein